MKFYKMVVMGDGMDANGLRKGYFLTQQQRDSVYQLMQDDEKRKKPFELTGVDRIFFPYKIEDLVECTLPSYEVMAYKYVKKQVKIEAIQDRMRYLEEMVNDYLLSDASEEEKEAKREDISLRIENYRQSIEGIRSGRLNPDSVFVGSVDKKEPVKIDWREKMKGIEIGGGNER